MYNDRIEFILLNRTFDYIYLDIMPIKFTYTIDVFHIIKPFVDFNFLYYLNTNQLIRSENK
jgi:hypothetical protein